MKNRDKSPKCRAFCILSKLDNWLDSEFWIVYTRENHVWFQWLTGMYTCNYPIIQFFLMMWACGGPPRADILVITNIQKKGTAVPKKVDILDNLDSCFGLNHDNLHGFNGLRRQTQKDICILLNIGVPNYLLYQIISSIVSYFPPDCDRASKISPIKTHFRPISRFYFISIVYSHQAIYRGPIPPNTRVIA